MNIPVTLTNPAYCDDCPLAMGFVSAGEAYRRAVVCPLAERTKRGKVKKEWVIYPFSQPTLFLRPRACIEKYGR